MVSSPYHLSSLRMISTVNHPLQPTNTTPINFTTRSCFSVSCGMRPSMSAEATSSLTYQKFVHFALQETVKHTHLAPSTLQVTNTPFSILLQAIMVLMKLCCLLLQVFFLGSWVFESLIFLSLSIFSLNL